MRQLSRKYRHTSLAYVSICSLVSFVLSWFWSQTTAISQAAQKGSSLTLSLFFFSTTVSMPALHGIKVFHKIATEEESEENGRLPCNQRQYSPTYPTDCVPSNTHKPIWLQILPGRICDCFNQLGRNKKRLLALIGKRVRLNIRLNLLQ